MRGFHNQEKHIRFLIDLTHTKIFESPPLCMCLFTIYIKNGNAETVGNEYAQI